VVDETSRRLVKRNVMRMADGHMSLALIGMGKLFSERHRGVYAATLCSRDMHGTKNGTPDFLLGGVEHFREVTWSGPAWPDAACARPWGGPSARCSERQDVGSFFQHQPFRSAAHHPHPRHPRHPRTLANDVGPAPMPAPHTLAPASASALCGCYSQVTYKGSALRASTSSSRDPQSPLKSLNPSCPSHLQISKLAVCRYSLHELRIIRQPSLL
jgi:hypothetical protein